MILNYTTKVAASKTVSEIQQILGAKGATHVSVDYDAGKASAVLFGIKVGNGVVNFKLPCNMTGVSNALKRTRGAGNIWRNAEQCERIAWRIVKDWVEAQMALVESQQAELAEVFLPYAIDTQGTTFFESFKGKQLALTNGEAVSG